MKTKSQFYILLFLFLLFFLGMPNHYPIEGAYTSGTFVTVLIVLLGRAVAAVLVLLYRPDLGVGTPSIRLSVREDVIIVVVS